MSSLRTPLLALVLTVGLGGCGGPPAGPRAASGPALEVLTVQPAAVPLERIVDGTVEAVHEATLGAEASGRVVEIRYDVNDRVGAGAILVRLKGTAQQASLVGAQAALAEARAHDAEAGAHAARIADMYARHVVSKSQFEQATAARDAAAARLAAAEAGVTSAREGVGYTEIRAPYAGVVARRLVEVGETVAPGTALVTMFAPTDLRVATYVPQAIVEAVRANGRAVLYIGDQRLPGGRLTVFPEAVTASGAFRARLEVPPGAPALAPGAYLRVGLVIGDTHTVSVPAAVLVEHSEITGVYVVDEHGAPALRYVRPGRRTGQDVEILAGLAAGERVARDPVAAAARLAGGAP